MLPPDVVRQIRLLQLRSRSVVANLLGGEYHSVFKGAGLAFADVRAYQPGDDVRAIDWRGAMSWGRREGAPATPSGCCATSSSSSRATEAPACARPWTRCSACR